jgi:hypothetical protein
MLPSQAGAPQGPQGQAVQAAAPPVDQKDKGAMTTYLLIIATVLVILCAYLWFCQQKWG